MSQDQIQLPEPDMEQVETYSGIAVNKVVTTPLYTATTVRRLIAEAVAAEREAIRSLIERLEAAELKAKELRGDHVPTPDDISAQDWSGMDGAIAYHLIDRHGENWPHIGRLMHAWRDAAIAAAKSAGEFPPAHHSPPSAAHPGLCAMDDAAPAGGLACDRVPVGVPPGGLERAGHVPASDHQPVRCDGVRGPGLCGGLAGERSDDGGMAE